MEPIKISPEKTTGLIHHLTGVAHDKVVLDFKSGGVLFSTTTQEFLVLPDIKQLGGQQMRSGLLVLFRRALSEEPFVVIKPTGSGVKNFEEFLENIVTARRNAMKEENEALVDNLMLEIGAVNEPV